MKKDKGMAWHVHHSGYLVEFCWSVTERLDFIDKHKPETQRATRKRLLKLVSGKLPADLIKSREAYYKSWKAYYKAEKAHDKAVEGLLQSVEGLKAWEAYAKAWKAYYKAYEKHLPAIEALHAKECPDCPWDGQTIFPDKDLQ